MTTDSQGYGSSTEGEHFYAMIGSIPWKMGFGRALWLHRGASRSRTRRALGRARYERPGGVGDEFQGGRGSRHGHRERRLLGLSAPDGSRAARPAATPGGKTKEWRNATFPAYQRRTKRADALIAGAYLSGTTRVGCTAPWRRCSAARWGRTRSAGSGADKGDWDVWNARSLKEEPIIRLILDGTVVRVRLDRRQHPSRCWSLWACAPMARRCC